MSESGTQQQVEPTLKTAAPGIPAMSVALYIVGGLLLFATFFTVMTAIVIRGIVSDNALGIAISLGVFSFLFFGFGYAIDKLRAIEFYLKWIAQGRR